MHECFCYDEFIGILDLLFAMVTLKWVKVSVVVGDECCECNHDSVFKVNLCAQ